MKKTIIWIFVLILTFNLVFALGIRPAKTTIIFDELDDSRELEDEFWIVNNGHREFTIQASVEGEMAEFIELEEELNFREEDDAKSVKFKIKLPDNVPPGISSANIVVVERLSGLAKDTVSAQILLKHKIIVQGPYPDKYIETKLNFFDQGDEIRMVSEVENLGKLDINKLHTKFYVNDRQQEQHVLETETINLKTKENKLLATTIDRDLFEQGEFEVAALTIYDDQQVEVVKNLRVGVPEIDITYFDKYFVAYKINEYSMDLLNKWNKEIKHVFVDVEVNKDDQKIDEFRTKLVDIEGSTTERINDYLDAKNKEPGEYTFEMIVNFWNTYQMETKTFSGQLLPEEEYKTLTPLTGAATASLGTISLTVVAVLIILGLIASIVYIIWRKRQKTADKNRKTI